MNNITEIDPRNQHIKKSFGQQLYSQYWSLYRISFHVADEEGSPFEGLIEDNGYVLGLEPMG